MGSLHKVKSAVALLGLFALASIASAAEEMPETSPEGLVLIDSKDLKYVYARPGASLDQYTKVVLFDAYVAFRKNWDRDYNRNVLPGTTRVRPEDMEEIKAGLAEMFKSVFTEELQDKRGYEIVETAGLDVLAVKPALINLDITAPQLSSTSMDRNVVASAGQMTLFMELYDSTTGEIIARVIDPAVDNRGGLYYRATSGTNKSAARKILRGWAATLGDHLGDVDAATTWEGDDDE